MTIRVLRIPMEKSLKTDLDTERLSTVNSYLKDLAERVAAAVPDLLRIRKLIDEYASVDPSTSGHEASVAQIRAGDVPAEWLTTASSSGSDRLLYVHGGSWTSGSLDGYRAHAGRLAEVTGCCVLNIDYRLAPEHPFPAGLDDCCAAFEWMLQNGPDGPGPARSVFVVGDSAGGNLILALLLRCRDEGGVLPDAAVALSPATDLSWSSPSILERAERDPVLRPERIETAVQAYLQRKSSVDNPYVSPLCGDLAGLPPVMLQVGEAEILYDDSVRFAERAEAAGVDVRLDVWPDMPHVFQMFAPYLPQADRALQAIGAFVGRTRDI
jgi:acetyl esterase/lipase